MSKLSDAGMEKINFAGGEPMLHPKIIDYCKAAKDLGMTVSVTTNGYYLNGKVISDMRKFVDWIGLSVDSVSDAIEQKLCRGYGNHVSHCIEIADIIHEAEIHLKVNSTITSLNYEENMRPLIRTLNPERWKVFQMLDIKGENDSAHDLLITNEQFNQFVQNHKLFRLENSNSPVFEYAEDMEGSYFMITPSGNVKIDTGRVITKYPLDVVLKNGINKIINEKKYIDRGGLYEWNN